MNRFRPNMQVSSYLSAHQTKEMSGLYLHLDVSRKDSLIFSDGTVGIDANGVTTGSVVSMKNLADQNQRAKGTRNTIPSLFTHVSSEMPTYSSSVAQCNGNPAIYMDASGQGLLVQGPEMVRGDATNSETPARYSKFHHRHENNEASFFAVVYTDAGSDNKCTIMSDGMDAFYYSPVWSSGQSRQRGPGGNYGSTFSFTANSFNLLEMQVSSNGAPSGMRVDKTVYVDGVSKDSKTNAVSDDFPPTYQTSYPAYIIVGSELSLSTGTGPKSNRSFKGYLCEMLVFDRALSNAEISAMRDHLNKKWGI